MIVGSQYIVRRKQCTYRTPVLLTTGNSEGGSLCDRDIDINMQASCLAMTDHHSQGGVT